MKPQPLAKSQILTYSSHQVTAAPAPQLDSEETLGLKTTPHPRPNPLPSASASEAT